MRRRRALLVAALGLGLAYVAFSVADHPSHRNVLVAHGRGLARFAPGRQHRASAVSWPPLGQAALVLGDGPPAASPDQRAAPIASLAKVMTAYLTLKHYPLSGGSQGFTITVTATDAQAEGDDVSEGQSGVAVQVGEQLTERQLLEALLIPSGNNIAEMLAAEVAGGESGFVDEMNAQAATLGMHHTVYTDPSGFDPRTVSTAADQLRIFRQAMRSAAFRQIVSMASVTLPVAGTLMNFNPLITAGFDGKTGSDSAAGGCLAFFTRVTVAGRRQTAVGVVMGQGEGSNTSALLAAAGEAAQQLVASSTDASPVPSVAAPPLAGSRRGVGYRGGARQLLAPGQPSPPN